MTAPDRSRAVALRRAYALLGALLVEGVNASRLAALMQLPALASFVDGDAEQSAQLDRLAADHYALFGHELFPFAGVFVHEDGLVGSGAPAAVIRQAHAALGRTAAEDPSPDHLGQGLRTMALLVDAELDATEHEAHEDAAVVRRWQRRVLDEALLSWMPPLFAALEPHPSTLWTAVVEMAVGVLAQHRHALAAMPQASGDPTTAIDIDALLAERSTSLRTVAQHLITPSRSGMYLARADIEAVAAACELPRGFGGRCDMVERLLRASAEYETLPAVAEALGLLLRRRDDRLVTVAADCGLAAAVAPWRVRMADTQRLLDRLAQTAGSVPC